MHAWLSEHSTIEDRQWFLNLVLEHSRDNPYFDDYAGTRKVDIFNTVKNFVYRYEIPLITARNVYGRYRKTKIRRKQITLAEAKMVLEKLFARANQVSEIMNSIQMFRKSALLQFQSFFKRYTISQPR